MLLIRFDGTATNCTNDTNCMNYGLCIRADSCYSWLLYIFINSAEAVLSNAVFYNRNVSSNGIYGFNCNENPVF